MLRLPSHGETRKLQNSLQHGKGRQIRNKILLSHSFAIEWQQARELETRSKISQLTNQQLSSKETRIIHTSSYFKIRIWLLH